MKTLAGVVSGSELKLRAFLLLLIYIVNLGLMIELRELEEYFHCLMMLGGLGFMEMTDTMTERAGWHFFIPRG